MEDIIFTTQAVIAEGVNPGKPTQEEEEILRLTEEVWNRFLELPINHPMEELEMYYTFFYEIRNGRRVLGKDRIKERLDSLL